MELKEQLKTIDSGRFEHLIDSFDIKEECIKCYFFNNTVNPSHKYRCAVTPTCIGVTLNLKSYILWRL